MNASRFALVDLALGVVLLGLLPAGRAPTPGEREIPAPAAASPSSQRGSSANRLVRDVRVIERWRATKERLLGEVGDVPDPVPAPARAEWLIATEVPVAGPQQAGSRREGQRTGARTSACDETEERTGRLRQAERRLLRLLASQEDRSDDRAEPGQDGSESSLLDELARLISWKKRPDDRPDIATRGRGASAAVPGASPRMRY